MGTGGAGLDSLYTDSSGAVAVPSPEAGQGAGTSYAGGRTTPDCPGAFGVMKMPLGPGGCSWDYQSAPAPRTTAGSPARGSFTDSGHTSCHGPAGPGG